MTIGTEALLDEIASHAMRLGIFERVNQHEPKNAPGNGLTCAIWFQRMGPTRKSGLHTTSAIVTFNVRVFCSMLMEPQDAIDPLVMSAIDSLLTAYSADFELGGNARCVDLLGMEGTPLSAEAGYVSQDNKMFRSVVITLPIIVNDCWEQVN